MTGPATALATGLATGLTTGLTTGLATVCVTLATALLVPGTLARRPDLDVAARPGRGEADPLDTAVPGATRWAWRWAPAAGTATTALVVVSVLVTAALLVVVAVDGRRLALALIALTVVGGVSALVGRGRAARAAERRREAVVAVCEALAGELRAGQPVLAGLAHAVEVWGELAPAAAAARLGADVSRSLRRLAGLPGAEGLADVAAAWQVSHSAGAGLAGALSQVASTARARQETRRLVRGELASAQATARLVALLPLASLSMATGIGGDPWRFLLDTPAGLACLGGGLGCAFLGLWWIDRIAAAALRG